MGGVGLEAKGPGGKQKRTGIPWGGASLLQHYLAREQSSFFLALCLSAPQLQAISGLVDHWDGCPEVVESPSPEIFKITGQVQEQSPPALTLGGWTRDLQGSFQP